MHICDAIKARKSVRAYLERPVDKQTIERILDAARWAPSGTNTQPWEVAVVSGDTKQRLQEKLETAFRDGIPKNQDYDYYPQEWVEPYKSRRKECGLLLYSTLQIRREDRQRQVDQWAANFRSFDAPVMLFFFINKIMEKGSYMDTGMFLQSVMLAAIDEGLATCPQAALAEYPDIVRQELGYTDNKILLCGMALGYEDTSAIVNSYRTSRLTPEEFTRFFD
jgi:nitroreductase